MNSLCLALIARTLPFLRGSLYISQFRYRRSFRLWLGLGTENPVLLPWGVAAAGGGKVRVAAELFSRVLLVAGPAFGRDWHWFRTCSKQYLYNLPLLPIKWACTWNMCALSKYLQKCTSAAQKYWLSNNRPDGNTIPCPGPSMEGYALTSYQDLHVSNQLVDMGALLPDGISKWVFTFINVTVVLQLKFYILVKYH